MQVPFESCMRRDLIGVLTQPYNTPTNFQDASQELSLNLQDSPACKDIVAARSNDNAFPLSPQNTLPFLLIIPYLH